MKRSGLLQVVLVLFFFIGSIGISSGQPAGVSEEITQLEAQVQEVRGLSEKNPIDVRFLSRDDLRQTLIEMMEKETTPEERDSDKNLLRLLGLVGPQDDPNQIEIDMLTGEIAGFYDDTDKYLALVSDEASLDEDSRATLAHEICHALQDQNYDLNRPPFKDEDGDNDDATFAATCLVEGDASILKYVYLNALKRFSLQDIAGLISQSLTEDLSNVPMYLRDTLALPYVDGMLFCATIYEAGGFAGIDAVYADPPSSTEQILHPEKYAAREGPMPVELPDIVNNLEAGWELKETDVMGEFDLLELLKTQLDPVESTIGAQGWGGSRYRFYQAKEPERDLILVDVAWDSATDAREFESLFGKYAQKRAGARESAALQQKGWTVWESTGLYLAQYPLETETLMVFATDRTALEDTLASFGGEGQDIQSLYREKSTGGSAGSKTNSKMIWVVAAIVAGLFVLGLVILFIILQAKRRERAAAYASPEKHQLPPPGSWK